MQSAFVACAWMPSCAARNFSDVSSPEMKLPKTGLAPTLTRRSFHSNSKTTLAFHHASAMLSTAKRKREHQASPPNIHPNLRVSISDQLMPALRNDPAFRARWTRTRGGGLMGFTRSTPPARCRCAASSTAQDRSSAP